MKTKSYVIVCLSIIFIGNVFAQQKRTTQDILMSYYWITPPAPEGEENLIDRVWYYDKINEYFFASKSRLWGHEEYVRAGRKPVQSPYYLSDHFEQKFDSTRLGQQTDGKYIIRVGFRGARVFEIMELNEEKLVLRAISESGEPSKTNITTWLARPRE